MNVDELVIVSVDDHVVEPRDTFTDRIPARFSDSAPHVIRRDDGREVWLFEGRECINFGLNAVVGKPPEDYNVDP